MTNARNLVLTLVIFFALSGMLCAADLKIIANPGVAASSISMDDLRGIFLQTKTSLPDGTRAQPVLGKSGPAHDAFTKEYLGKNDSALQTYYRSLVFTGKGSMPKVVASDADIVAFVAHTKGAIGYVSAGAATPGVKTLDVK